MRDLAAELKRLQDQQLYRQRRTIDSPQGVRLRLEGREYLSFCSNDYLGLANHPQVRQSLIKGAERWGVGSGASHLVCGHSRAHHALEEELAEFTGRPRALLFSSGYMANMGVTAALCQRGDLLYEDRLNHASLLDGALLAGARLQRYPHGDSATLAQRLADGKKEAALVVTDGVFSMDGDLAPLPELAEISRANNTWLMVDDAHGLGVLGANGGGSLEHFNLGSEEVPVLIGTLGKAFGTSGAFVAGSETLIEYLIQKARTYIYTTAMPAAVAEATRTSLGLIRTEGWRRQRLAELIGRFRHGAGQLGLDLMPSETPIQPLLVGESAAALELSRKLLDQGLLISAIRPPTVPQGAARLRITLSADHSEQDVDYLLTALEQLR